MKKTFRNKKFMLESSGLEIKKNILSKKYISKINSEINHIMQYHVNKNASNSELFSLVTRKSKKLRENVFKSFSKLISCLELLSDKKLKNFFKKKKYKNLTLISFAIVIMEPNRRTFLFPIHQDLKHRLSLKSILMWIPLNKSNGKLGGMTLYENSHKFGPLKHEISKSGIMQLNKGALKKISRLKKVNFTKYNKGDILFISPYLAHQSIVNTHDKESRWTLIIQVDDITSSKHFSKSLNPFNLEYYSTSLTNEEIRKNLSTKNKIK